MNNSTDDNTLSDGIALLQLIVYIPVLALGIPLNAIAFWVFCCKLKGWTETKVYMINLIVADSFLLFTLPFVAYLTKYKHPADRLCTTIHNIYFTNMPMSIFIITLIAIDRYIAIKFPLKAKVFRSPLKSASICGFLWITLIIYCNVHPKLHNRGEKFCFRRESLEPTYTFLLSSIFGYFIPLGIVIFCSVQVIRCLKKNMATSPHETKLIQKAVHIVSVNLFVFIVCFSPLFITMLVRFAVEVTGASSLVSAVNISFKVSGCLANCNCCLDAFCYYFAAKEFPEFSSMFPTCMRSKTNENQESQPPTDQVMA
ncbi:LOW QUALITY PROTEIN: G-protein coupled receptor 35-like [Myiozetetes cayanensis]|uniref:LOW QUALITY PROTEIN: G-protein coupled receptor 35-like n=1 Tax=Myiozetetes cayanensis TaxID=478635 RepID=UPI00215FA544|nr:LOW QUALITY PROTEIN: G-protein coupled receptor 35-like [Myiozetetes cayanensis]